MNSNKDFQKRATAYSLLAHIKNNGTLASGPLDVFIPIVKNALSELYPSGTIKGGNICEIVNTIKERFSLEFPIPVMCKILKRISAEVNDKSGREDMRIFNDGAFWIEKYIFEDYSEAIQESKNNISKLVSLFKKFCEIYKINSPNNEKDLFRFIDQNRADISYYLTHEEKERPCQSVIAAQFVDAFRNFDGVFDNLRNVYLGSMLVSFLEYQPAQANLNVELLLDTNFIISLLDLNTPESTKTCNTLIEVSRSLGYSFTVLKDTIEEIQGLLSFKSENLNTAVIAKTINREDVYNACDRRHLSSTDLDRISDNLEDILTKDYSFQIVQNTTKLQNKAKYSNEYKILKQYRNTDKSALHDAMALIYVREKRKDKKIYEFEKVNCWFVNNAITHDNESEKTEAKVLQERANCQSEIIKVDDLLNILWLSNPSIAITSSDVVDMGLASMVSYTINSSLPKARIIKELDDNIQKYRKDQSISDTDVIRLSTRIVNRQIKDIQELNKLAGKDQVEFANKIKEEARKQELIERNRAQKLESLMSTLTNNIKEIKENQDKMKQKHTERMQQFDLKKEDIENKNRDLSMQNDRLDIDNKKLRNDNEKLLKDLWKKENNGRKRKRESFIEEEITKEISKAKKHMLYGICFTIAIIICYCSFYPFESKYLLLLNNLAKNTIGKVIAGFVAIAVNCYCVLDYYNVTLRSTPSLFSIFSLKNS